MTGQPDTTRYQAAVRAAWNRRAAETADRSQPKTEEVMKFIKLTTRLDNPIFVRPELIDSFGPAQTIPQQPTLNHNAWIHIHGDKNEIFVLETCDQISRLLDV